LKEVLAAATADGRKMIWDVAAPEELLIESRSRMSAASICAVASGLRSSAQT
jgi:hypothetical protein